MQIGTFEAKNRFSELVRHVMETGEEVHITHRGKPMAKLVPEGKVKPKRKASEILQDLMDYADKHGLRSDGVSIKEMIEEGRKY